MSLALYDPAKLARMADQPITMAVSAGANVRVNGCRVAPNFSDPSILAGPATDPTIVRPFQALGESANAARHGREVAKPLEELDDGPEGACGRSDRIHVGKAMLSHNRESRGAMRRDSIAVGLIISALLAGPALADPCEAIPKKGPMPAYLKRGAEFSGPVVYVGDGDGLCVAARPGGPAGWVEVRLSDFYAPELYSPGGKEAKAALERVAMGKRAVCVASHRNNDRVVASCTIKGRPIGDLMRRQGIAEGGNGYAGGDQ